VAAKGTMSALLFAVCLTGVAAELRHMCADDFVPTPYAEHVNVVITKGAYRTSQLMRFASQSAVEGKPVRLWVDCITHNVGIAVDDARLGMDCTQRWLADHVSSVSPENVVHWFETRSTSHEELKNECAIPAFFARGGFSMLCATLFAISITWYLRRFV